MRTTRSIHIINILAATTVLGCTGSAQAQQLTPTTPERPASKDCNGLSTQEQRTPLLQDDRIVRVRQLSVRRGKAMLWQTEGAEIYLNAQRGETAAWIERRARCQASASATHTARAHDPLAVASAKIRVVRAGTTFAVSIRSSDRSDGREIWRRAAKLSRAID